MNALSLRSALRAFCLFLLSSVLSCQETDPEFSLTEPSSVDYAPDNRAVANVVLPRIKLTKQGVARKELNELFRNEYEIDFEAEYQNLLKNADTYRFFAEPNFQEGKAHRTATAPPSPYYYRPLVYSFDPSANVANAFSEATKGFFVEMYKIIDPNKDENRFTSTNQLVATVKQRLDALQVKVNQDQRLSQYNKSALNSALNNYRDNIGPVVDLVIEGALNARTTGFS